MRRKNYKSFLYNLIFISLFFILIVALTGCGKKEGNIEVEYIDAEKLEEIEVPENQVLVLSQYSNPDRRGELWGEFIYSDGGVYSFNLSWDIYNEKAYTMAELTDELEILMQGFKPIAVLDELDVKTLYALSTELDDDKSIDSYTKHVAYDAGTGELLFYNGNKFVVCRQTGDYAGRLRGEVEEKLLKFYDKEIIKKIDASKEETNE